MLLWNEVQYECLSLFECNGPVLACFSCLNPEDQTSVCDKKIVSEQQVDDRQVKEERENGKHTQ